MRRGSPACTATPQSVRNAQLDSSVRRPLGPRGSKQLNNIFTYLDAQAVAGTQHQAGFRHQAGFTKWADNVY